MARFRAGPALLLVGATLAAAGGASAQVVRGRVVDALTGDPVPGATLALVDIAGDIVRATDSDASGHFQLRAPAAGFFSVQADGLGYASFRSDPVSLVDDGVVDVRLRLGVEAIPLAPFVVLADSQIGGGRAADFDRRRRDPSLSGYFVGAEEIERRPMATPSQLLRAVPGVDLYPVQTGDNPFGLDRGLIYLPGARGGSLRPGACLAQLFVNGIAMRQTEDGLVSVDDVLEGAKIVGVEVYTRAFAAPLEFRGTGECGVVLYWTEEPGASSGSWSAKRVAVGFGAIVAVLLLGIAGR